MVSIAALSLKCYSCDYCGSKNGDEITCQSGLNLCMKVYAKDNDGKERIGRACSNKDRCEGVKEGCQEAKKDKTVSDCASGCCDTDLCNAGSAPSFSVLVITLCALFSLMPYLK